MNDLVLIGYSDLEFYELLGRGAKGSVYRAKWISADRIVAVKRLLDLDLTEARILSQVKHKNVISFIGAVSERPNYCVVSELADLGCLFDYLHDPEKRLDFAGILAWAKQIASGMKYLHEEAPVSIIHRDLKSKNIVISSAGRQCKICDFGSSKTVVVSDSHVTLAGTPAWMAVELMIADKPATKYCDSWSYGVVLWELLTRELPFRGLEPMQIMYVVVKDGERLPIPASCPAELANLMRSCWAVEPFSRPTCGEVLKRLRQFDGDNSLQSATAEFLQQRRAWQEEIQSALGQMQRLESQLIEARLRNCLANQRSQAVNNLRILRLEQYDVNAWREIDVSLWLRHHTSAAAPDLSPCCLAGYAELLMQHNITGERFLRLVDHDLQQMGVATASHRASLLRLVGQLQKHNYNYRQYPPLSLTAALTATTTASPASPVVARSAAAASASALASPSVSVVSAAAAAAFRPVRLSFIVNRLSRPDGSWKLCVEIEPSTVLDEDTGENSFEASCQPAVSVDIDSVSALVYRKPTANEFGHFSGLSYGEVDGEINGDFPADESAMVGVGYSYVMADWLGADSRDRPARLRVQLQAYPPELDISLTPWTVPDDANHRAGVCQLVTRQVQVRQPTGPPGLSDEDLHYHTAGGSGGEGFDANSAPKIAHHVVPVSAPATPSAASASGVDHRPTFADMVKRAGAAAPAAAAAAAPSTQTAAASSSNGAYGGRGRGGGATVGGAGGYRRCESSDYNSYRPRRYQQHPPHFSASGAPRHRRLSDIVGRGGGNSGGDSAPRIRRSVTQGFS